VHSFPFQADQKFPGYAGIPGSVVGNLRDQYVFLKSFCVDFFRITAKLEMGFIGNPGEQVWKER
jgi:hypothetical protein